VADFRVSAAAIESLQSQDPEEKASGCSITEIAFWQNIFVILIRN